MMQEHVLTVKNSEIIRQLEARTFKFGKARDGMSFGSTRARTSYSDKLINNVKITDLPYERSMVYLWIKNAIGNIKAAFPRYSRRIEYEYESGHDENEDYLVSSLHFCLSSKWPPCNADVFDSDCMEYVINSVIYEFLSLSLPQEAEVFRQKALLALKNAERKLYFKMG